VTERTAADSRIVRVGQGPDGARHLLELLVVDAPPEANTILAAVERPVGWIRVGLIVLGGSALWAAIIFGALAMLRR
jgi:hypothetical protein